MQQDFDKSSARVKSAFPVFSRREAVLSQDRSTLNFIDLHHRITFMDAIANIPTVAHVIQQAVAPVFLLTGVAGILGVLTNRLGRSVDRFRALSKFNGEEADKHYPEMLVLARRAHWIHWAISLCTLCALLICMSIVAMFVGVEFAIDLSDAVSLLFIAAMLVLIGGLLCFLREIALATGMIAVQKWTKP
jgi:hypothetical protein